MTVRNSSRRNPRIRRTHRQPAPPPKSPLQSVLDRFSRLMVLIAATVMIGGVAFSVFGVARPAQVIALAPAPIQTLIPTILPPLPTNTPTVTPTPVPPFVALLAGHSGGIDTGAVCPDGLREVDITKEVASRAQALLQARGYRVDILAEFDKRLETTYSPQVFLAIHVDSCVYYATGYKVARADNSAIPQEDDRLTRCVSTAYSAATNLPFHAGSITTDMTHYHGLEAINPKAPGAIIELGFLGSDRGTLNRRDVLAAGITEGIDQFVKGSPCQ